MAAAKILVASSQPVLREGVRATLAETPYLVWFEADDRLLAVSAASTGQPDVCLVDIDLREGGLAATWEIVRAVPSTSVIVLADRSTETDLLDAVRAGARGFLGKDLQSPGLAQAIRSVIAGEAVIPRRLVGRLLDAVRAGGVGEARSTGRPAGLTPREIEILQLVCDGRSTKHIAAKLFVAPVTVRTHVSSILHKLCVGDRQALVEVVSGQHLLL